MTFRWRPVERLRIYDPDNALLFAADGLDAVTLYLADDEWVPLLGESTRIPVGGTMVLRRPGGERLPPVDGRPGLGAVRLHRQAPLEPMLVAVRWDHYFPPPVDPYG